MYVENRAPRFLRWCIVASRFSILLTGRGENVQRISGQNWASLVVIRHSFFLGDMELSSLCAYRSNMFCDTIMFSLWICVADPLFVGFASPSRPLSIPYRPYFYSLNKHILLGDHQVIIGWSNVITGLAVRSLYVSGQNCMWTELMKYRCFCACTVALGDFMGFYGILLMSSVLRVLASNLVLIQQNKKN